MASEAQSLLEKYRQDNEGSTDLRQQVLSMARPSLDSALSGLKVGGEAAENKKAFTPDKVAVCMKVLGGSEANALEYILTVLYDMFREDTSNFHTVEDALRTTCKPEDIYGPMVGLLKKSSNDAHWVYVADKSAWVLTAIIGHMPKYFTAENVTSLCTTLANPACCSELGVVEAFANLLKAEEFRAIVWQSPGVAKVIFKADPKTAASPILYKSIFAIWMVSFDVSLAQRLSSYGVVSKLKNVLSVSRTEKVIRLCLTVLKNFLAHKSNCQDICTDIVEEGVLETVQQLEYEKWRDTELYDDIREVGQLISSEMKELSNFDRYMRELETGKLSWGFIHSSKFFGENIMKFENGEFKAIKLLASLLSSNDATTLAVACHDIGEFVSLHPMGKKQVGRLGVKERVMELMGSTDQDKREVRREALLCCQKIMLNKWQEVANADKK